MPTDSRITDLEQLAREEGISLFMPVEMIVYLEQLAGELVIYDMQSEAHQNGSGGLFVYPLLGVIAAKKLAQKIRQMSNGLAHHERRGRVNTIVAHCIYTPPERNKMARLYTLPIRLSEQELTAFQALADRAKLPVGTFVRQHMLFEADRQGIVPSQNEDHSRAGQVLADSSAAVA